MENEWDLEPDYLDGKHLGYSYQIKRHPEMKHLCGYVVVPRNNFLYNNESVCERIITCHGGITYAKMESKKFIIGFDCAHSGDRTPSMDHYFNDSRYDRGVYRNIDYVKEECYSIIQQIKSLHGFKYYDMSGYSSKDVDEKYRWCNDNCHGKWNFLEDFYNVFVFQDKKDFMFYRLRWGVGNE